jgi:hypothetical protein
MITNLLARKRSSVKAVTRGRNTGPQNYLHNERHRGRRFRIRHPH